MPTILREGPYRFFLVSLDREEPPHVHIRRNGNIAKFWLDPVVLQNAGGFGRAELNAIAKLIYQHQGLFLERWHAFFECNQTEPRAQKVSITEDTLVLDLFDGRSISVPLLWYPRLCHGTFEERQNFEVVGDGRYLHWSDLDEDLTVEGIVGGHRSYESAESLKKWLASRKGSDKQTV